MTIRSYKYRVQALIQPATGTDVSRSVSQTLGVSDDSVYNINAEFKDVSQDLGLLDFADGAVEYGGVTPVSHDLGLSQEVHVFGWESLVDDLGLSDIAEFNISIVRRDVSQNLGLTDGVEYGYLVRNMIVDQDLGVTDATGFVQEFSVTQELGLTDEARFTDTFSDLGLTDVAEWGYGYDVAHALNLTDEVFVNKILFQTVSEPSFLTQAVTYFVESRCNRYNFTQFHGEGGNTPAAKKLNYKNRFLIQSLDDGEIIQLRNPETDDRRRYAFNRVNRDYFDGSADVFVDDSWAVEETQIYTIIATKRDDLETLFTFLSGNLGREVLIKDWRGVTWIVIITNPGEVYTEDSEGYWTIDFEVTGVAVDGEYVLQPLGVTQAVSRAGSIYGRSASNALALTDVANRYYEIELSDSTGLDDDASFSVESP